MTGPVQFLEADEPLPLPVFVTRTSLRELLQGRTLQELAPNGKATSEPA